MASWKRVGFVYKFIGLSSETKPTQADNRRVSDGVEFWEADTSKCYVYYDGQWYEKKGGTNE